ncbi:MAG: DUF4392 domain-containing protein [Sulfurospirillum sp.]|nr:DUF4392 domain-containing protein [Sulfurospirillum sp.]
MSKSIDEIILQHSTRGMNILQKKHSKEHCKEAAGAFKKLENGVVFLYTGFYVEGFGETDGPIGTYFLALALNSLGYKSVIITDKFCQDYFKEIETLYIPLDGYSQEYYYAILEEYNPICHFSIERCGKNIDGLYTNLNKESITKFTAPLDDLFVLGGKTKPTFAIGDGGNELGMGNFSDSVIKYLSISPCAIESDFPIIATVSNWGAYGFIAYLDSSLLPSFDDVDKYLGFIVGLGSIDGVSKKSEKTVDGKEWIIEKDILEELKKALT